jgi:hypothetical protein
VCWNGIVDIAQTILPDLFCITYYPIWTEVAKFTSTIAVQHKQLRSGPELPLPTIPCSLDIFEFEFCALVAGPFLRRLFEVLVCGRYLLWLSFLRKTFWRFFLLLVRNGCLSDNYFYPNKYQKHWQIMEVPVAHWNRIEACIFMVENFFSVFQFKEKS